MARTKAKIQKVRNIDLQVQVSQLLHQLHVLQSRFDEHVKNCSCSQIIVNNTEKQENVVINEETKCNIIEKSEMSLKSAKTKYNSIEEDLVIAKKCKMNAPKTKITNLNSEFVMNQFMLIAYRDQNIRKVGIVQFKKVVPKTSMLCGQWYELNFKTKKLQGLKLGYRKLWLHDFYLSDIISSKNIVYKNNISNEALHDLLNCGLMTDDEPSWKDTNIEEIIEACSKICMKERFLTLDLK
jgi:hypothetical protein